MSTRQLHHVAVTLGDGCLSQAEIVVEELPSRDWTLVASIPGMPALRVDGDDLFECLRGLMRTTDSTAVRVLCNGARRDAWASGMLRDMNGASKVYLTNLGKPARRSDLAPIFGLAPVEHVGSVEEQDRFHREWLRSLEKGNG